jgi:hypothetical protein
MPSPQRNKVEKLRSVFPELTDENQQYMLGISEGLKFAQTILPRPPSKKEVNPEKQKETERK